MKKILLADFCIFFFSFSALVAFMFCAGNFQGFTERTQLFLLNILEYSSFFCALSGAGYLAYLVIGTIRKTIIRRLRDFTLAGTAFAFGLSALFVSQFIIAVTLPKL